MWIVAMRRKKIRLVTMFSIAVIVLNLLTWRYLVSDDIQNADLSILAGRKIAIDPGHGGIDGGANSNNVMEKEITLQLALKLADILKNNGANIVFTREDDSDYYTKGKGGKRNDLLKRIEIIETSGAEMFVSIHCNAFNGAKLFGAQVLYNPKLEQNKMLAETLQRSLRNFPDGNKRQAQKDERILLLKAINKPGVLIETGYLTNKQEASLLAQDEYQQKMAEHIAKALAYHLSQNVGR